MSGNDSSLFVESSQGIDDNWLQDTVGQFVRQIGKELHPYNAEA